MIKRTPPVNPELPEKFGVKPERNVLYPRRVKPWYGVHMLLEVTGGYWMYSQVSICFKLQFNASLSLMI